MLKKPKRQASTSQAEDDEVEHFAGERRLAERRTALPHAPFPPGLRYERRGSKGRREEDLEARKIHRVLN